MTELAPNRRNDNADLLAHDQTQQQQAQRLRQEQQRKALQDVREMQAQAQQIQLGSPFRRADARF